MRLQVLLTIPTLSLSLQAGAACIAPRPSEMPVVPDGSTASEVELHTAQQEVNTYVAAIEQFLECRGDRLPSGVFNGLVMRAEEAADAYNIALGKYMSRQSTVADN